MNEIANYTELPLNKENLLADPLAQFQLWYEQAQARGELEPSAMTLATVNRAYEVTARMVLLKSCDQNGFGFFTNYLSPKAKALQEIANAALVFWWPLCQRQVRITGTISLLDKTQSAKYFAQRSRDSQIAAIVSKQSEVITNREYLLQAFEKATQQLASQPQIECPDYWGGYRLAPNKIEFWQGRAHRLHDRFEYRQNTGSWEIVQLSP